MVSAGCSARGASPGAVGSFFPMTVTAATAAGVFSIDFFFVVKLHESTSTKALW